MGQTLSRDPAVSDVLFVHLWCSVLGKAVGRRIEEQADSCCRQKSICWQRGSQVSQFPLAPLNLPLSTSRGSCDLLRRPGEGRCLCSSSACWLVVTGGLSKLQQQLINMEVQAPTGSFFHYPVLKTDSPFLRSQATCPTAQHPDRRSQCRAFSWGQPLLRNPQKIHLHG